MTVYPVQKSEEEWKAQLTEKEYAILRQKDTEEPGATSEFNDFAPKDGYFTCKACDAPLYSAAAKFQAGCGWPSFDKCYIGAVTTAPDPPRRIEILCAQCGGHLGHVFGGEGHTPNNERHCVNSLSVKYHSGSPPSLEEKKLLD